MTIQRFIIYLLIVSMYIGMLLSLPRNTILAISCPFSGCSASYPGYWYSYTPNCSSSCTLGCDGQWPSWPSQYSCRWDCGTCTYTAPYGTCTATCGGGTQYQDGYNPCNAQCYSGTVACNQHPCAPTANSATNIATTSFTANWSTVSGATGYKLDVSTANNFSSFVSGYNNLAVSGSQSVSGLSTGTTYYYRVRADNGYGTSTNSNTITLMTVPAAPASGSPTNITTSSFTANWSSSTGASSYVLDVSTANDFSSFVSGYNNLVVSGSQNVTGLSAGTTYYYRIRALNAYGTSPNSNTITAVTVSGAPVLGNPTNISATGFTANWGAVSGATSYVIDVATGDASGQSSFSSFVTGYNNTNVGNVTTKSVTGLTANTTYFYRVRAVNAGGTSTQPSNYKAVTTAPTGNACPITIGAHITISSSCYFPGNVNGSDDSLTLQSGATLTINANQVIVWSPGKSITLAEDAAIAINSTGQLTQSDIWVPVVNAASSVYPSGSKQYARMTQPTSGTDGFTQFRKRKFMTDIYTIVTQ